MEWFALAVCMCLLGRAGMAVERKVRDTLWAFWFPFDLTFRLLSEFWKALKWLTRLFKNRKPAYGDARFAGENELKAYRKPGGYIIGRLRGKPLSTHEESCIIMLGKRGSGKSNTMGCTLARATGENFVVVDPPCGLLNRFRPELEGKGYRVITVNLKRPLEGDGYNPMAFFARSTPYDFEAGMDELARLMALDKEMQGGADTHFSEIGMNLIGGLAAFLLKYRPAKASLYEVARILSAATRTEMMATVAEAAACGDPYVSVAMNAYMRVEDKERGSIDSTVSRKTKKWLTPMYRELCRPGWDWDDALFASEPVAVFVTGGMLDGEGIAPVMRVIVGQCVLTLGRRFEAVGVPARHTKLLLDEADSMGRCKPIYSAMTEMRKAKVSCFMGYQSLSQLKANFGEKPAQVMIDNSDLIFTGGLKDTVGYELCRKMLGRHTVYSQQKSKAGVSESEAGHDLLGVDGMFKLDKGKHLVLLDNKGVMCDAPWSIRGGEVVYQ